MCRKFYSVINKKLNGDEQMNEISCFLNSKSRKKNVALLIGNKYTYENLREFVKDISIDHLIVINPFPDSKIKEMRKQLEYDRIICLFNISI